MSGVCVCRGGGVDMIASESTDINKTVLMYLKIICYFHSTLS